MGKTLTNYQAIRSGSNACLVPRY